MKFVEVQLVIMENGIENKRVTSYVNAELILCILPCEDPSLSILFCGSQKLLVVGPAAEIKERLSP